MAKTHLKRIAAPRTWPLARKLTTFVRRPRPGTHRFEDGMSLQTWLIELLGIATTAREARNAIRDGAIRVNGRAAHSQDQIVGLFDVISIEGIGDYLISLTPQNKLTIAETTYTGENLSRIEGKHLLKGGVIQYRLFNGWTERTQENYTVGQTVIVKDGKIHKVLPLEKGSKVYFTRGSSVGRRGDVKELEGEKVTVTVDGKDVESHRDTFVVVTGFAPLEGDQ